MNAKKALYQLFAVVMILGMAVSCVPAATPTSAPAATSAAPAATAVPAAGAGVAGKIIYNVGFLKGHPVIRLMTLGFVVGCEELGYKYKLLLTDGSSMSDLVASYEQAIAEKADGIVSFVQDPALGPVVAQAGKANIPVISAHFPQKEGDYPGLTAWVAADTVKYAQDVAASMGAELRKRGIKSGTIAVTEGSFNSVENTVAKTFTEEMNKNFPEFKILAAQEEGFDPPVAIAKASAIISANPDIVGAMSTTGAGPTTWARGAEETGKKDGEIVIISMDYTRPNLDLVKAGKVYGLVGQPLFQEFHDAVYLLDKVFKGEKITYDNPMVAPIITLKDLDTYYKLNDDVEAKLGAGANAAATPAPAASGGQVKGVPGKVVYNVGFLKGHPVIRLMTLGFVVGCEELGYKYKLLLTDGSSMSDLVASYEQAIAEKADGIVSFVQDPALGPVVAQAGKANIPVISAHFPQKEGDYPGLTAWVAADTVKYAQDVAASMGAELRKRGIKSGTIAVTEGSFNSVENTVAKTFTEEMNKNFPEFKILAAQEEGFDPPVAIAKASAIISANPDIVGAMSTTGAGPTTWARGAEETGKKDGEIVIISMDYTRPNLDLVKAGKVYGLVGQPLFQEFHDAVYLLDKVFKGEKITYDNPMVAPIITLKDLDTYYKLNDDVEAKLGAGANAAATPAPAASGGQVKGVPGKVVYNVGFLKGHPVIRLMTLGFVVGCEELGYKYKLLLTDGSSMSDLVASYEQAIAEKADGIVSFVQDPALGPVVAQAGKANIPVISAHFPQKEGDYPGLTAWVAADTVKYAQDVAASMGAELRKRGIKSGTIAVTEGSFNSVENTVAKTFTSEMNKNFPEFKILAAQEEGFDPPVAIAKASAIISANPDIVGAMSTTGAGPTTWARGAEETGKKDGEIVIISMDYTRPNLDLVKAGKVYGLVGQPLFQEFHDAVYLLDKVFKGEKITYDNPMVAPIITLKDLDTYYKLNDDVEAKLGAGANAAATATPKP